MDESDDVDDASYLRRLTEKMIDGLGGDEAEYDKAWDMWAHFQPEALLAILDEREALRATVARVEALADDWYGHGNDNVYETAYELAQVVREAVWGRRPVDIELSPGLPVSASEMPDDCHDACTERGIFSIYYPHRWDRGVAQYECADGHRWTCGWGHIWSGTDLRWRGVIAQRFYRVPAPPVDVRE